MKDLKLRDGDLIELEGDIEFVEGDEQIAQSVYVILQTQLGEFIPEKELGLDRSEIIGKGSDFEDIENAVATALLQEERVEGIEELELQESSKKRSYTAGLRVTIKEGETIAVEGVQL